GQLREGREDHRRDAAGPRARARRLALQAVPQQGSEAVTGVLRAVAARRREEVRLGLPEPDRPGPLRVRSHQLANRVEHDADLRVVLLLERLELALEVGVRLEQLPQPYERTHDLDVDLDRALAAQHAGEHRDALLGERVWIVATAAPRT